MQQHLRKFTACGIWIITFLESSPMKTCKICAERGWLRRDARTARCSSASGKIANHQKSGLLFCVSNYSAWQNYHLKGFQIKLLKHGFPFPQYVYVWWPVKSIPCISQSLWSLKLNKKNLFRGTSESWWSIWEGDQSFCTIRETNCCGTRVALLTFIHFEHYLKQEVA